MKKLLLLLCLLLPLSALPINISVRIYADSYVKTVILAPKAGKYLLIGDGKSIDSVTASSVYEIKADGTMLDIKTLNRDLGKYTTIKLKELTTDCTFNIKPVSEKTTRQYNDELLISNLGGNLKMLNIVQFEHYLAGVVECEAGQRRPVEFYKAQAVICRTYSLINLARHLGEDYELCDIVHCQVYKGTADIPEILQAVEATKGQVIVDNSKHLINAAYHSNCGGYTVNSEDVWSTPLPYLRAVKDSFCLNQLHATWEKHFSLNDWASYLEKKEASLTKKDTHGESYWDSVPEQRKVYFYDKGYLIPLKDMRLELGLHSTYFTMEKKTTEVILRGRGNGHRVGFCQEGAIHMAQKGYTYLQMLHFYYQGIQLIDSSALPTGSGTK
jgi:stage II sporulation protein D